MSDEEKKALDNMKSLLLYSKEHEYFSPFQEQEIDDMNIVLNLVEKQSKEIEELKEECKEVVCIPEGTCFMLKPKDVDKKWEDKIKAILGIEENLSEERILSLLETIVDENARLEDIEDGKVQIEYNNVFNKGVKSVEYKIKAKIEEIDEKLEYETNGWESEYEYCKAVLQSLLEKE